MSLFNKDNFEGFGNLIDELKDYIVKVDHPEEILEVGAKEFVKDLLKLPKPISKIRKSGYTHLITTFCYQKAKNNEIEVGWGKYYGPLVENGTKRTKAQSHLVPTFKTNEGRYYQMMINKFHS